MLGFHAFWDMAYTLARRLDTGRSHSWGLLRRWYTMSASAACSGWARLMMKKYDSARQDRKWTYRCHTASLATFTRLHGGLICLRYLVDDLRRDFRRVLSAIWLRTWLIPCLHAISLFSPPLTDVPIVDSRGRDFHGLDFNQRDSNAVCMSEHTVICSRKKSKSSSQFVILDFAAPSFESSNVSASSSGYESITFACKMSE